MPCEIRLTGIMTNVLQQNGVTILELDEHYDSLSDAPIEDLAEVVLETAGTAEPPALLLDLSRTRFIGSRFIGILVRAWSRIRERNGRMALCCVAPHCREALISTRLYDTLWAAYETRDEAVSALK